MPLLLTVYFLQRCSQGSKWVEPDRFY